MISCHWLKWFCRKPQFLRLEWKALGCRYCASFLRSGQRTIFELPFSNLPIDHFCSEIQFIVHLFFFLFKNPEIGVCWNLLDYYDKPLQAMVWKWTITSILFKWCQLSIGKYNMHTSPVLLSDVFHPNQLYHIWINTTWRTLLDCELQRFISIQRIGQSYSSVSEPFQMHHLYLPWDGSALFFLNISFISNMLLLHPLNLTDDRWTSLAI